jgi:hypothetical protein
VIGLILAAFVGFNLAVLILIAVGIAGLIVIGLSS